SRNFFCGTIDDYEREYAATADALRRVTPHPQLMPYPFLGDPEGGNMNALAVYQWLASQGLPVTGVGQTANQRPDRGALPAEKATTLASSFDRVYGAAPAFKNVRPFIDQF